MRDVPKYLTEEEFQTLLSVVKSPRDRAILVVARWRGLRASEIGLLKLSDLRLKAGRILVARKKNSRGGEYLMSEEELRAIRAWLRVRGQAPGPLFASRNHRPISRYMLHVLMRRYCALAGIDRARAHFHVLKHTCGTWLMGQDDAELRHVQDWLGHVNVQNTTIYAQVRNPDRERFARKIYGRG